MSEVKRKKGESFEGFMRRTKQEWLRSGMLYQARKVQFFVPEKSKNVRRESAVLRIKKTSKLNYLRKIGKLAEKDDPRMKHQNKNQKRR